MSKVIFITGASKGFGKHWAETALRNGYNVVATARQIDTLDGLVTNYGKSVLPLQLDVNDRKACLAAVRKAVDHFKTIDVLISNAGYGQFGMVEEISEADARQQLETNILGSLWVIQAALPYMRQQKSGHIIQVSSIGGVVAFPSLGIYHASKWAVEGLCDSLSQEVAMFGIKVTLVEPSGYATDWGTRSAKFSAPHEAYEPIRQAMKQRSHGMAPGNPLATGEAIMKLIESENPPLRLFLGALPLKIVEPTYQKKLETWKAWSEVSSKAQ
jgi:NADP-dependent 3-hydroxy acid dehydrogenase YdfG